MKLYKSGTSWCLWRWTITDSEYITRLHLVKTPWFAICLHWINKPDAEPWMHDHPVSFVSFILRGGYFERRLRRRDFDLMANYQLEFLDHRWFNYVRASDDDQHRITHVLPKTVTLVFMGPKVREWGFHTPQGWIHWKRYYEEKRGRK